MSAATPDAREPGGLAPVGSAETRGEAPARPQPAGMAAGPGARPPSRTKRAVDEETPAGPRSLPPAPGPEGPGWGLEAVSTEAGWGLAAGGGGEGRPRRGGGGRGARGGGVAGPWGLGAAPPGSQGSGCPRGRRRGWEACGGRAVSQRGLLGKVRRVAKGAHGDKVAGVP